MPILYLLARSLRRNLVVVLGPGVMLAAVMIGVDVVWGSAAFGVIAIVTSVVSNIGQSVELVRAPDVRGVSGVFLTLAVGSQILWLVWALLVNDAGTFIAAISNTSLAVFNLTWFALRRLGLRPLFTPARPATDATLRVEDRVAVR